MRFLYKLRSFFAGRYGIDTLYYVFLGVFTVAWLARLFTSNIALIIVFWLIQALCLLFMLYRALSRNIWARRNENEKFKGFFKKIKSFFVLQKNRIRDAKSFRYRKCPHCCAMLRLPKRKGTHPVVCPRCKQRFEVKIGW